MNARTLLSCMLAGAAISCGGQETKNATGDTGSALDASALDANGSIDASLDAAQNVLCPSSLPGNATSCDAEGIECEYGGAYRLTCNTIATCKASEWLLTAPATTGCSSPMNDNSCPGAPAQGGTACGEPNLICTYATGACECPQTAPQTWSCFPTPSSTSCPFPRPTLGTQCAAINQLCRYSSCGDEIECQLGVWHHVDDPCN